MGLLSTTNIHKHYGGGTEYIPYTKEINITEKRAPTDESIKLFKELEEKARESIVYKAEVNTNEIKAVAIGYLAEVQYDIVKVYVRFQLNGKEITTIGNFDRYTFNQEKNDAYRGFGHKGVLDLYCKKMGEVIAEALVTQSPEIKQGILNGKL